MGTIKTRQNKQTKKTKKKKLDTRQDTRHKALYTLMTIDFCTTPDKKDL